MIFFLNEHHGRNLQFLQLYIAKITYKWHFFTLDFLTFDFLMYGKLKYFFGENFTRKWLPCHGLIFFKFLVHCVMCKFCKRFIQKIHFSKKIKLFWVPVIWKLVKNTIFMADCCQIDDWKNCVWEFYFYLIFCIYPFFVRVQIFYKGKKKKSISNQ